jgi:hypothetical protein
MVVCPVLVDGVRVVVEKRSIYLDREDAKTVEEEERNSFLRGVLEKIGVPVEEYWPDIYLTIDQKISLRDLLSKLEIEIIDNTDRGYTIYHKGNLFAEWFKPKFITKQDKMTRNPSKKLYFEMVMETWSIFD